MSHVVIFPGQGAATPGAGAAWRAHDAWRVITEAEEVLDRPLARLLLEADADELATTRASQLAVFLGSLMAWDALAPQLPEPPLAFAGHSLGQITALVAAGALDRADGYRLAARRADVSQDSADAQVGRMAALVGADLALAEKACTDGDAWVANDNAPGQIVIAGTPEGLERASERAKELGARRVMPLAVGHAFHTPLLADAAEALGPLLDELEFREPSAPIVTNTDAAPVTDPAAWPQLLRRHLVTPVRWTESQRALVELGATTFVEAGPGKVLAGLAKRTVPDVRVVNVAAPDDVAGAVAELSSPPAPPAPPT
ncbi:MAG TPA: ACP S-malonyltransferase, partial [Acidimicrobiales bacterium]